MEVSISFLKTQISIVAFTQYLCFIINIPKPQISQQNSKLTYYDTNLSLIYYGTYDCQKLTHLSSCVDIFITDENEL